MINIYHPGLTPDLGMDMKPSTSILYANGPSYQGTNNTAFNVTSDNKSVTRENISDVDTGNIELSTDFLNLSGPAHVCMKQTV